MVAPLLDNVKDIVVFLSLVINSHNSPMFSCSRNTQVTFAEKPQLKRISFQNYNAYLIRQNLTFVNLGLSSLN